MRHKRRNSSAFWAKDKTSSRLMRKTGKSIGGRSAKRSGQEHSNKRSHPSEKKTRAGGWQTFWKKSPNVSQGIRIRSVLWGGTRGEETTKRSRDAKTVKTKDGGGKRKEKALKVAKIN